MNNEPGQEFTEIEELAEIPLSELVEPQDLVLPQIEAQDLELPQDYLQDLTDRGVITEGLPIIDIDSRLLVLQSHLSPKDGRIGGGEHA
ncbi:MAG TPA: hypothetical protein VEL31_21550 [Ktedonobacteraceae bacterium]|nr:hypothetical protein [Ktedonobacteraceae bacterium]